MHKVKLTNDESDLIMFVLGTAIGRAAADGNPKLVNALLRLANSVGIQINPKFKRYAVPDEQ